MFQDLFDHRGKGSVATWTLILRGEDLSIMYFQKAELRILSSQVAN